MDSLGWLGPEPARCWDLRWLPLDPLYPIWDRFPTQGPNEAMNSIQPLQLTGAAISVVRSSQSRQAAPAAERCRFGGAEAWPDRCR